MLIVNTWNINKIFKSNHTKNTKNNNNNKNNGNAVSNALKKYIDEEEFDTDSIFSDINNNNNNILIGINNNIKCIQCITKCIKMQ